MHVTTTHPISYLSISIWYSCYYPCKLHKACLNDQIILCDTFTVTVGHWMWIYKGSVKMILKLQAYIDNFTWFINNYIALYLVKYLSTLCNKFLQDCFRITSLNTSTYKHWSFTPLSIFLCSYVVLHSVELLLYKITCRNN